MITMMFYTSAFWLFYFGATPWWFVALAMGLVIEAVVVLMFFLARR